MCVPGSWELFDAPLPSPNFPILRPVTGCRAKKKVNFDLGCRDRPPSPPPPQSPGLVQVSAQAPRIVKETMRNCGLRLLLLAGSRQHAAKSSATKRTNSYLHSLP